MPRESKKGICYNTGRTHFRKGIVPWNKKDIVEIQCPICNNFFQVKPCRKLVAKYCSYECRNASYVSKQYDDGYKENMSKIAKQKGFGKWMLGKVRSEETKAKHKANAKRGEDSNFWKGGKIRARNRYIRIHSPQHPFRDKQDYVFEHRLIMEKKIGRFLHRWEVVHHINHITDDNEIENLQLFKNQASHKQMEGKELFNA